MIGEAIAAVAPQLAAVGTNLAVPVAVKAGEILLLVLVIAGVIWALRRSRTGEKK
jgi:uncharacterized membrane protein YqjE